MRCDRKGWFFYDFTSAIDEIIVFLLPPFISSSHAAVPFHPFEEQDAVEFEVPQLAIDIDRFLAIGFLRLPEICRLRSRVVRFRSIIEGQGIETSDTIVSTSRCLRRFT